jgi:mitochondrial FAD-linked sulfhydryl oxidase
MPGDDERRKDIPGKCPTPAELGVSGWNILHSSAAVYPYKPTEVQQKAMKSFIESWAHVYACSWCAYHMRDYVQKHPPDVRDKVSVSRYVCELHNEVSERLGKDLFDCSPDVVLRRWHPGYPDKMEDKPTIEEQLAASAKKKAEAAAAQRRQQEAEERRFSDFGLPARDATPREAAGWRDPSTATKAAAAAKTSSSSQRWWFFGSSAFNSVPSTSPAAVPPPSDTSSPLRDSRSVNDSPATAKSAAPVGSGSAASGWNAAHAAGAVMPTTLAQTPNRAKAADDETDVDAVLERLKRCQVYCPEDEALQKH